MRPVFKIMTRGDDVAEQRIGEIAIILLRVLDLAAAPSFEAEQFCAGLGLIRPAAPASGKKLESTSVEHAA